MPEDESSKPLVEEEHLTGRTKFHGVSTKEMPKARNSIECAGPRSGSVSSTHKAK
tara:strand:- start:265 stop:429 length:165 start_codon:yes stop_codon:yes gene_type:complete